MWSKLLIGRITMKINDLIAELEASTDGSRELDNAVFLATHPDQGTTSEEDEYWYAAHLDEDGGPWTLLPFYTTSLDAALTLVPDGWGWTINHDAIAAVYAPKIEGDDDLADWGSAPNGTPALALCIASLKARQVSEQNA